MTKQQFLDSVRQRLAGLPQTDIERWLDYYAEMIDDRVEDGIPEAEAVAAMGSPEYVASQILMDTPLPKLVKARSKPSRCLRGWEILLLILGSPLWMSLLLAGLALLCTPFIALGAVVFSLYAVVLALGVSAITCFIAIFHTAVNATGAAGAGLILTGIAILLLLLANLAVRSLFRLGQWCIRKLKIHLIHKGGYQ